jgi:hypothetical protein
MISVPERDPGAVGVKVTPTVQDCPGVSSEVQPFELTLKSPLITGLLLMISVCAGSVFCTVTVSAALVVPKVVLGNESVVGETESCTSVPLPCSSTVCCGLVAALSEIVNVPERVVALDGVKVTVIVQLF